TRDDRQWRLAILSNNRGRHREAGDQAREILSEQPGEPMVVAWSLMRGYEIDLEASRMALRSGPTGVSNEPAIFSGQDLRHPQSSPYSFDVDLEMVRYLHGSSLFSRCSRD